MIFSDRRIPLGVIVLSFAGFLLGCGGSGNDGPQRYEISGTVTFDGKPVPKGRIEFVPAEGNTGPGSGADIVDGEYETPSGKGIVGGPHEVTISGWDGIPYEESGETVEDGKELFPQYKTTFSFPKEDSEKDFEVPGKPKS